MPTTASGLSITLMIIGIVCLIVTATLFTVYLRLRKRARVTAAEKEKAAMSQGLGIKSSPIENTPKMVGTSSTGSGGSSTSFHAKYAGMIKVCKSWISSKPHDSMVIGTPSLQFAPGHVLSALEEGALSPAGPHSAPFPAHANAKAARVLGIANNAEVLPMPATVASLVSANLGAVQTPPMAAAARAKQLRRPMNGPTSVFGGPQAVNGVDRPDQQGPRAAMSGIAMHAAMEHYGIADMPMSASETSNTSGTVPATTSASSGFSTSSSAGNIRHDDTSPRRPRRPTLSIIREANESNPGSEAKSRPNTGDAGEPRYQLQQQQQQQQQQQPQPQPSTGPTSSSLTSGTSGDIAQNQKISFETARGTIPSAPNSVHKIHRVAAPSFDQAGKDLMMNYTGSPRKPVGGLLGLRADARIASLGELPVLPTFTSLQFSTNAGVKQSIDLPRVEQRGIDLERMLEPTTVSQSNSLGSRRSSRIENERRISESYSSRPLSGIAASAALLATLVELGDLPSLPSLPSVDSDHANTTGEVQEGADLSMQTDSTAVGNSTFLTNMGSVQDISFSQSDNSTSSTMTTALSGLSDRSLPQPPVSEKAEPSPPRSTFKALPPIFSPELLASKSPFVSPYHKTVFPDKLDFDEEEATLQAKKASMAPVLAVYLAENAPVGTGPAAADDQQSQSRNSPVFGTAITQELLKHRSSFNGSTLKAKLKPSLTSLSSTAVGSMYNLSPALSQSAQL
ncbi:hypothetical protein OC845_001605 [Tilletia horrida]|nr:hypothetical protein OC845_001605 [Tilletia horrida]